MRRWTILWIVGIAILGNLSCRDRGERLSNRILEWERTPTAEHVDRIRACLEEGDASVRAGALAALARLGAADAKERSRAALGDPDASVRAAAVKSLLDLHDAAAVPELARIAVSDPDWRARRGALVALGILGSKETEETVLRGLSDPSSQVRLAAVEAASALGPELAVPDLSKIVAEEASWEVRAAAAEALGKSRSGEAYAPLTAALGDPNEFVRAAAAAALRELGRQGVAEPAPTPPEAGDAAPAPAGVYSRPRTDS